MEPEVEQKSQPDVVNMENTEIDVIDALPDNGNSKFILIYIFSKNNIVSN